MVFAINFHGYRNMAAGDAGGNHGEDLVDAGATARTSLIVDFGLLAAHVNLGVYVGLVAWERTILFLAGYGAQTSSPDNNHVAGLSRVVLRDELVGGIVDDSRTGAALVYAIDPKAVIHDVKIGRRTGSAGGGDG